MKKRIFFLMICVFCISSLAFAASDQIKIGKVDLGLAVSLHPRMALFDFDRMGFFRIPAGLTREEFDQKLSELKNAPVPAAFEAQRQQIRLEISRLDRTRSELFEMLSRASAGAIAKVESDLKGISKEHMKLENLLADLDYQENCRDLTSPAETRKILDEIESQVMVHLENLSREKGYGLVLNNSITVPFNYPQKYKSGNLYGLGVPGIDFSLFYSFLANREHLILSDETPQSRQLINWLELIHYPPALNLLPIKPYPLVISGGDDLTLDLIKRIYTELKVDSKVIDTLNSVLEIVMKHDQKFDSNLESLVGPK